MQSFDVTLTALATFFIHNSSYSELSGPLIQSLPPVNIKNTQVVADSKYALGRKDQFSIDRQPEKWKLSTEVDKVIIDWFSQSQIYLKSHANTQEKQIQVKRLFFTWRDCFAKNIRNIRAKDLMEHSIDLKSGAHLVQEKLSRYTAVERAFANEIFPLIEDASIII